MLNELRRFNVETGDLPDLVALLHYAKGIQAEYSALNLPSESWIDDKVRQLNRAIQAKTAEQRELRLAEIRAERSRLKTPAERRAELEAEEAALLGKV